ncbi:hypothetical protein C5167_044595 [Papaver somniferum]|uniref:Uncharacterized protein n=1 Tax=Papaver somniferum TaxID=3469 RepID=A0A4Y7LBW7_PAPSO|nr:hypothetical protein C5167_044595 [Papaver somniferum]
MAMFSFFSGSTILHHHCKLPTMIMLSCHKLSTNHPTTMIPLPIEVLQYEVSEQVPYGASCSAKSNL